MAKSVNDEHLDEANKQFVQNSIEARGVPVAFKVPRDTVRVRVASPVVNTDRLKARELNRIKESAAANYAKETSIYERNQNFLDELCAREGIEASSLEKAAMKLHSRGDGKYGEKITDIRARLNNERESHVVINKGVDA